MARVLLEIDSIPNRMTLKALLEAEGHVVVDAQPEVAITDTPAAAAAWVPECPALVLATASDIPAAVKAMRDGVYGYIFVPFQPGEAALMVARACGSEHHAISSEMDTPEPQTLAQTETERILAAMRACRNNQTKAARSLGIGRNTLWRKLKRIRYEKERERRGW